MKYSEKADQYTALSSFLINGTLYFQNNVLKNELQLKLLYEVGTNTDSSLGLSL